MNIIINITPDYQAHAVVVFERLQELGDNLKKVLVLTNAASKWTTLNLWAQKHDVEIKFHIISPLADMELNDRFDSIIYGRLFLNEVDFFNRGLYLDVDIWPQQGLTRLWTECDKNLVYGVQDLNANKQINRLHRLGFEGIKTYINAGVILFNDLAKLEREFAKMQKLIAYDFKYHDQDIINIVLGNKFTLLPSRFNHMSFSYSRHVILVHFAHSKPWRLPCFHQSADKFYFRLKEYEPNIVRKWLPMSRIIRLIILKVIKK